MPMADSEFASVLKYGILSNLRDVVKSLKQGNMETALNDLVCESRHLEELFYTEEITEAQYVMACSEISNTVKIMSHI